MTRGERIIPVVCGLTVFTLYAATAGRSITWWEGSLYPLLARTLSIANPPGSLLLTLVGWAGTTSVFVSSAAFQLNLIACAMAAAAAALVARVTLRLASSPEGTAGSWVGIAAAAGSLSFAAMFHVWTYATQFTPYIMTALFTAMLLAVFVAWWDRAEEQDALPWLFVLMLLFGLDVSVHRTNALWLPVAIAGIVARRGIPMIRMRVLATMVAGFTVGLSVQLLYLVLSRREPFLDLYQPRTLAALAGFVRLDPIGGGFLVELWPRRADLVHVQLADWAGFLWRNLAPRAWAGALWSALAVLGFAALWRRERRLALVLGLAFAVAGIGGVIFFNRPAVYFRPLDRHYLPSLVLLAPWAGVGLATLGRRIAHRVPGPWAAAATGLVGAALVVTGLQTNVAGCDRSRTHLAESYARDLLEPLPRNAILFTNGDNDTFPLWYMQCAAGLRTDVLVLNIPSLYPKGGLDRVRALGGAFASIDSSSRIEAAVVDANAWRRPVYVAVTVQNDYFAPLAQSGQLEGLAWRIPAPGDTSRTDEPLERFVAQRLPRAGIGVPGIVIEPDIQPLLANYVAAGIQLVFHQARRGDREAAQATLTMLQGLSPAEDSEWARQMRKTLDELRRWLG